MSTTIATKSFEVEEWTLENSYYQIVVRQAGHGIVDAFCKPTIREARLALLAAGYNMGPNYRS